MSNDIVQIQIASLGPATWRTSNGSQRLTGYCEASKAIDYLLPSGCKERKYLLSWEGHNTYTPLARLGTHETTNKRDLPVASPKAPCSNMVRTAC